MNNKPLPKKVLNLTAVNDFGFTLFINLEIYYFSAFLTDVAGFSLKMLGIILTITEIINVAQVPITGWIIEKANFKWGKYRSWFAICPPIMVVAYGFMFSKISMNETVAAIIIILAYAVKTQAQNLPYSASVALVSDLSNDQNERLLLSTRRAQWLTLGNIVFSAIVAAVISFFTNVAGSMLLGYSLTAVAFGFFNWAANFVTFKVIDGCKSVSGSDTEAAKENKLPTKDMFKAVFFNPPLLVVLLADTFKYLSYFLISSAAYYYFLVVIQNYGAMAAYLVITRFAGILGSSLNSVVGEKLGKKKTYILSNLICAAALAVCYWYRNLYVFVAAHVVYNIFVQISLATLTALLADTVIYYKHKTGVDARGFIMTMLCVPIKVGSLIKGVVLSVGLAAAGYVANSAPSAQTVDGVAGLMSIYPAAFIAFGVFIFALFYKLTESEVDRLTAEIEER